MNAKCLSLFLLLGIFSVPSLVQAEELPAIHLVGASTCAKTSGKSPQRGWGQMISKYFNAEKVSIKNWAVSGTSAKSFRARGFWDKVKRDVKQGDYVLIQFGTNDGTPERPERYTTYTEFTDSLKKYITEVRALGANPVLLTVVARRYFVKGKFLPYANRAARSLLVEALALEMDVPLIDCHTKTCQWIKKAGDEKSKGYFCHYGPNNYPAEQFRNGRKDDTHLNEAGADYVARLVAKELKKIYPDLR